MAGKLCDAQLLEFLIFDWLKAGLPDATVSLQMQRRELMKPWLLLAAELAEGPLHACARQADELRVQPEEDQLRLPLEMVAAVRCLRDQGFFSLHLSAELGGRGLPLILERACCAIFAAANPALAAYVSTTLICSRVLQHWGTAPPLTDMLAALRSGKAFGSICLTEVQAGSSLTDVQTHAIPDGAQRYRLFGEKAWVAGAQHNLADNIVYLVLARVPDDNGNLIPGVQGLSLFAVPAQMLDPASKKRIQNDVHVLKVNRTLGYRGLVNCHLGFGEGLYQPDGKAGALAWLVGPLHRGLAPLLQLMNETRTGIALFSAAIAEAGYQLSLQYAREREQGRVWGTEKQYGPPVPIIRHGDVKRMLLRQKCYAEAALALSLYCAGLQDEERTAEDADRRHHASLLLELLIPVAKSWSARWGTEANHLAMQIFGGLGYAAGCPAERMFRDNQVHAIQQGTQGILAIDLLGRKLTLEDGAALELLGETMHKTLLRSAAHPALAAHGKHLARAMQALAKVSRQLLASPHPEHVIANATPYMDAFGHIVMAWIWLELALCADAQQHRLPADFCAGKQAALGYFYLWELPRAELTLNQLALNDTTALLLSEQSY